MFWPCRAHRAGKAPKWRARTSGQLVWRRPIITGGARALAQQGPGGTGAPRCAPWRARDQIAAPRDVKMAAEIKWARAPAHTLGMR